MSLDSFSNNERRSVVDEANDIVRAKQYGITPQQLRKFEGLLAQGAVGYPPMMHIGVTKDLREKSWMVQAAGMAREIGEEQAIKIATDFMGHQFPDDTPFAQVLEQLPEVYRRRVLQEGKMHKILPIVNNYHKIHKK